MCASISVRVGKGGGIIWAVQIIDGEEKIKRDTQSSFAKSKEY